MYEYESSEKSLFVLSLPLTYYVTSCMISLRVVKNGFDVDVFWLTVNTGNRM